MSENEQRMREGTDPREERLRLLCAAVYEPVEPSEALRRRVAGVVARRDTGASARGAWWQQRWTGSRLAAGTVGAALLLAVAGLVLVPHRPNRSPEQQRPSMVKASPPPVSQLSPHDPGRRIATGHPVSPGTRGEGRSPFSWSVGRDGSSRPRRAFRSPRGQSHGVDDLTYVNRDPEGATQEWVPLRQEEWAEVEARVRRVVRVRDDFVTIPFPRLAAIADRPVAQAVESYKREAAIVDPRLSREVTCAYKATALSDLCDALRADTGIALTAGPSLADEKVTLFCERMPLREVMRQLSRPFGYTWLRSQRVGSEYRYELAQDLRSQLLEEELRNRDRNEALLALDREIQQFRPYLDLSPDQALEKAETAPPAEKRLLTRLSGLGWGVIQLYFRLSPEQVNSLRAGQELEFNQEPGNGKPRLPQEMAADVLSSLRHRRLLVSGDGVSWGYPAELPTGVPPSQVEGAHPLVHLQVVQSELGQYTLEGYAGLTLQHPDCTLLTRDDARALGPLATGISPSAQRPNNAAANARFSTEPALQRRVAFAPDAGREAQAGRDEVLDTPTGAHPPRGDPRLATGVSKKVTSAEVLEALHRATGMPVVADAYTRLYPTSVVCCENQRLYEALNRLADAMRLRWRKDGKWLQFRSAGYFQDRLKEVPNRLLNRWSAARQRRGSLGLDELLEIAGLPDPQLDASAMAEGARERYGLEEWDLARNPKLRPHWRFLAVLTPEQRQEAAAPSGLAFARLTLPQQQEFVQLALGTGGDALPVGLKELAAATLKIDYTVPGWYQWPAPGTPDTTLPGSIQRSTVRERTRAAALAAARKLDPAVSEADVVPTSLDGTILYTVGTRSTPHAVRVVSTSRNSFMTD